MKGITNAEFDFVPLKVCPRKLEVGWRRQQHRE